MKRYLFIIAALALASCGKWLDEPRPMGQVDEKDLYKTEDGFKNVLTGAYIDMGGNQLYGMDMSIVYPELFAQQWGTPANSGTAAALAYNWDYPDLKRSMEASYTEYYNIIVNLNSLLGNIDDKRDLFTTDNFNLVKGEALGLRAFLHFDVLRLWGPCPAEVAQYNTMDETSVPYVTEVTRSISKLARRPYKDVLKLIETDLLAAEKLLVNDPITRFTKEVLASPSANTTLMIGDDFYYYRHSRMNLYAVKATLARYYMWTADYEKAKKYAKEVIDGVVAGDGGKVFNLCDTEYMGKGDLSFESEHIFSISRSDMEGPMRAIFKAGGILQQTDKSRVSRLYEGVGNNDIRRESTFWASVTGSNKIEYQVYKKFIRAENESKGYVTKFIPLIRLSEMYLIGSECCLHPFNKAEIEQWFTPYALARNINPITIVNMSNEGKADKALESEFRLEFLGEGQMFYRLKRLGITQLTWPIGMRIPDPGKYVVKQPDNQIMFE